MSYDAPTGRSPARLVTAVILAVIAALFIAAGVIYILEPAATISPAFLGRIPGSTGHHALRGTGVFVIAGLVLIAGGFALFYQPGPSVEEQEEAEEAPIPRN